MPKPASTRTSAVQRATRALRRLAAESPEGTLLGSEDDLTAKLGVSAPTLRQAAALVAQENLIKVRRGVNGGYFSTLPSSETVARVAAIYLHSRRSSLKELIQAIEPIRGELAKLAARNADGAARLSLEAFLESERTRGKEASGYRQFLQAEREFGRVLGALSGNGVLGLFLDIVYDLASHVGRAEDVYLDHPERIDLYREHRNRMAAAILEGDEELAMLATRRCSMIVAEWMNEDMAERGFDHTHDVSLGLV